MRQLFEAAVSWSYDSPAKGGLHHAHYPGRVANRGWIFSNGQAERLRRYSPLCYVAPILPAQPPLKVRYHALTAFPSAHSCDLEETHQTEKGDRHDAADAKRNPNPHG